MCNPNYFRLKGRSEVTQLWLETASNLIFFSGYGLIIFSSGFRLFRIIINVAIVVLLHLFVFPILGRRRFAGKVLYKRNNKVNKAVEQDNNVTDENEAAPDVFYRYYAFDKKCDEDCKFNKKWEARIENIFRNNEIYFAKPKELNDPLDSKVRLSYDGTEEQWKDFLDGWYRKNEPNLLPEQRCYKVNNCLRNRNNIPNSLSYSFLEQMGVYCMSAINNDILMWSHYSNGHSGFCLEFDANNEFFGRAQRIDYPKEYPNVNFFTSSQWEKTKAMLLTKAKRWHYEREWRIIDHNEGSGIKHFPAKTLTGVIIGCRMSKENKQKIIKWCANRNPQPTLYKTEPIEKEFGFEIIEIVG